MQAAKRRHKKSIEIHKNMIEEEKEVTAQINLVGERSDHKGGSPLLRKNTSNDNESKHLASPSKSAFVPMTLSPERYRSKVEEVSPRPSLFSNKSKDKKSKESQKAKKKRALISRLHHSLTDGSFSEDDSDFVDDFLA